MNCVLCGRPIKGKGHNPEPLAQTGRCCDECNYHKIVPARGSPEFSAEQIEAIKRLNAANGPEEIREALKAFSTEELGRAGIV